VDYLGYIETTMTPESTGVWYFNIFYYIVIMINIDTIESEWEKDCEINPIALDSEALDIGKLHNKYLKYYNQTRLYVLQLEDKLADENKLKTMYYTGKLSKEELDEAGLEPFPHKVLRNDVKQYLETDNGVKKIRNKIEYYKIVIEYLKNIIEQINKRNFSIKAAIDWKKFTSGVV
jgi:hypothetical protein